MAWWKTVRTRTTHTRSSSVKWTTLQKLIARENLTQAEGERMKHGSKELKKKSKNIQNTLGMTEPFTISVLNSVKKKLKRRKHHEKESNPFTSKRWLHEERNLKWVVRFRTCSPLLQGNQTKRTRWRKKEKIIFLALCWFICNTNSRFESLKSFYLQHSHYSKRNFQHPSDSYPAWRDYL